MRVLVVYKKSMLDLAGVDLDKASPAMVSAHNAHKIALDSVATDLESLGLEWKFCYRAYLGKQKTDNTLVITVGGDGTVLDAGHKLASTPVLGINSDPERSVGLMCSANTKTFKSVINDIVSDKLQPTPIPRMYGFVNDKPLPCPAMNEVLVCDANPAAMSRYTLDGEEQKSSGVWVSAPMGSTGAIASSGGDQMPIDYQLLQYKVREPYVSDIGSSRLLHGFTKDLTIVSKMRQGRVYIDGRHQRVALPIDSVLRLSLDGPPLKLFLNQEAISRRESFIKEKR